jgi:hypothetical protein
MKISFEQKTLKLSLKSNLKLNLNFKHKEPQIITKTLNKSLTL